MSDEGKVSGDQHRTSSTPDEFHALQSVITALSPLDHEARRRILESVATFLGVNAALQPVRETNGSLSNSPNVSGQSRTPFSDNTSMSAKEFLMEKAPRTDVERIACLGYYLTHYRSTPHFKTLDISAVNTEAAQPKFSNTAYSTNNAVKMGYLVPATKGHRQLSALGERFVQALPDRDAAKDVLQTLRRRHRKRKRSPGNEMNGDE